MNITIRNDIPREDLALGVVWVTGVKVGPVSDSIQTEISKWIKQRTENELDPEEDELRKDCRTILRNGKYKPSGRAKPASEYLLRSAKEGNFPSINGPVDVNNLLSIKYCLPISLCDIDRSEGENFVFKLGQPEEEYVFNSSGQTLGLQDLVHGRIYMEASGEGDSRPIISPIKDSMATKVIPETSNLLGVIYFPLIHRNIIDLEQITMEFLHWLRECEGEIKGTMGVVSSGGRITLTIC